MWDVIVLLMNNEREVSRGSQVLSIGMSVDIQTASVKWLIVEVPLPVSCYPTHFWETSRPASREQALPNRLISKRHVMCVIHLILRISDVYLSVTISAAWQVVCMSWELGVRSRLQDTRRCSCDGPTFHECQILIIKNSGTFLSHLTFTCLKPKMSGNV